MANWLVNEGPRYLVYLVWLAVNVVLFVVTYVKYASNDEFFYLRAIVGSSLPWARSSAMCLNFNCMLLLLPVCRNLLSYIRGCSTCCKRTLRRQLDKHITFHILLAYAVCFLAAIHISAHCFNFERLLDAFNSKDGLVLTLSTGTLSSNSSYLPINPITNPNSDAVIEIFKTISGVTGIVMTLALILMVSSATFVIRRSVFEVFYYTHHLFVVFFVCLLIHGIGGLVRGQTNVKEHNPRVCAPLYANWLKDKRCPTPWFAGSPARTWIWIVGPIAVYVIERLLRRYRAMQTVKVTKVVAHPSNVFEIQLHKSAFSYIAGQYILLNCPQISWLEWHPFTLTSAPEDEYFSIHVRRVGDWTNALAKACHTDESNFEISWKLPRLCVDGPFGAPAEDFFRYDVDILIGTGIGITPFASILKHIWYKIRDSKYEMSLCKVYVVWICRETAMFEWFHDMLNFVESQLRKIGRPAYMEYDVYLTRGWDSDQARNIILHDDLYRDVITGLRQKTQFGRPQWDKLFTDIVNKHPSSSVGVFFCGAPQVSKQLHKLCNQYSSPESDGTRFFYNKEHF